MAVMLCGMLHINSWGMGVKVMAADAAHKKGWQIFEVVFGLPFLAAIALHFIVPIALPGGVPRLVWIAVGIIFVLAGVTLVTLTRQEFARYSQPTDPGLATSKLITTGVFSFSQNPLYLGGILFLMGISLAFSLTWGLILLVPSIIACHYILIVPEEKYLAAKFGEQYREYAASVHRWVGRKAEN
jgi:protein-S-isoprenylcysteine O-methyltransferase Ste14